MRCCCFEILGGMGICGNLRKGIERVWGGDLERFALKQEKIGWAVRKNGGGKLKKGWVLD